MLTETLKKEIKNHALEEYPNECCGLLVLNKNLSAIRCKNISNRKEQEFNLNPSDYLKCALKGKIVGIYHSHGIQENSFSELDKQVSHLLKLKNVVYIVKKDQFEEYNPEDYFNKYSGREFKINDSDCVKLIEDYYNEEFGIKIFHYNRDEQWDKNYTEFLNNILKENNKNNFDELLEKEGFKKVETPQKHDLIAFKYKENQPSHFGVYLQDGYILHQTNNRKSVIEKLTTAQKRRIYCFARHKNIL